MFTINRPARRGQRGFTLIELMIVVAIIGVLSSIAIPAYLSFVAKAKFSAALFEVTASKTAIDSNLNDGTLPTLANIGVASSTNHCTTTLTASLSSDNTITCTIVGGPTGVNGETISVIREVDAVGMNRWRCESSVAQKYIGRVTVCDGA